MPRLLLAALAVLFLSAGPAHAAVTPGWSSTGKPAEPRVDHAAVLLGNGKVLVAGGYQFGSASLASAELYDPATGAWSPAAPMREPREGFSLLDLRDGRVMAVGGDANHRSAEIYDPARNVWEPAGQLSVPRQWPVIVGLNDGSVLVAGGYDPRTANTVHTSAEVYDGGRWQAAGTMPDARFQGLGVALPPPLGGALITGGTNYSVGVQRASYFRPFLPANEIWRADDVATDQREAFTLTPFGDGKVLAAGGTDGAQSVDASRTADVWHRGVWSRAPRMASEHYMHAATGLRDGRVMVISGLQGLETNPAVEIFNGSAWASGGVLAYPRAGHSATLLPDGRVLVAGGGHVFGAIDAPAELWTPTTTIVADAQLAFGQQAAGTAVTGSVRLTNTGGEPLFTDRFELGGAHPGDFALGTARCPRVVAPGAACHVDVRFTPTVTGERSATLNLHANTAVGAYVVALSGVGTPAPATHETPADGDGDGVADAGDRCAALTGPAVRQGCPAGLLADPSIAYRRVKGAIKVVAYYVKATKGARVVVKCSKGCKRTVTRGKGAKRVRIKRLNGKRLTNGTKITVTVSMPGRLTTTVTDRITRARRVEGRPRCAPVAC